MARGRLAWLAYLKSSHEDNLDMPHPSYLYARLWDSITDYPLRCTYARVPIGIATSIPERAPNGSDKGASLTNWGQRPQLAGLRPSPSRGNVPKECPGSACGNIGYTYKGGPRGALGAKIKERKKCARTMGCTRARRGWLSPSVEPPCKDAARQ